MGHNGRPDWMDLRSWPIIPSQGPHHLAAQDTGFSSRRQGFKSPWGRQRSNVPIHGLSTRDPLIGLELRSPAERPARLSRPLFHEARAKAGFRPILGPFFREGVGRTGRNKAQPTATATNVSGAAIGQIAKPLSEREVCLQSSRAHHSRCPFMPSFSRGQRGVCPSPGRVRVWRAPHGPA